MKFKSFLALAIATSTFIFAEEERYPVGVRNPKGEKPKEEVCEGAANFFWRTYPETYFPYGTHSVIATSAFGDSITIEDGSIWTISSFDAPKIARIRSRDPIIVTQNHSWFSFYDYRIINQSTGDIFEANLSEGPVVNGIYTRYIVSLDPVYGEIILNDGTCWQVSSYDLYRFDGWFVDDAIIVGYNSGWDKTYNGLLINVTMNQHIRVAQF